MAKEKKWLALEIDDELNNLLEEVSKKEDRSKASLTRVAIKEFCKNRIGGGIK